MRKLPWFRLYARMIDDDSIRLLAFEDRWHFVALCCLKGEGLLDRHEGEMLERRVALKLGVQLRELDEIHRRLMEVGLVDGCFQPCNWDELQYKSDSSAKRVKAYRERQKKQTPSVTKRKRNVTVTAQETDTDTEVLSPKGDCASGDALKVEHVIEIWNEVAPRISRPCVRDITPERRQLTKARIAQYSMEDFGTVFAKIEASEFLRGDKSWKGVTFDWVMKKGNFQKIIEGNYDD